MFQFALGFATCAVLSVAFPTVGVVIHLYASKAIVWARRTFSRSKVS